MQLGVTNIVMHSFLVDRRQPKREGSIKVLDILGKVSRTF